MLVMPNEAVPLLVNVTTWGALPFPRPILPNIMLIGLRLTDGAGGVTPVPESVVLFGLDKALDVTANDADLAPNAVGVKVTLTTQLPPAARVLPQVFVKMTKSPGLAPVKAILLIAIAAEPALSNVIVCAPTTLPTALLPKARLAGVRLTVNVATPVPESGTLSGLVEAFVVNVSAAVRTPAADGVKVTLTVQLSPVPRLPPQVLPDIA